MIQNKVWYSLIYLLEKLDWNTFKFIVTTLFERKLSDAHMLSKHIYTIVYRCTSFNVDFGQIYIYFNILIKQNETAMVININSLSSYKKTVSMRFRTWFRTGAKMCVCGGGEGRGRRRGEVWSMWKLLGVIQPFFTDKRLQHFNLVHITRKWIDWFQHQKYTYWSTITISISYW